MGDDIKGPMKDISSLLKTLKKTRLTPYQTEILDKMERADDKLFRIIDDIMDYSTIDAGLMKFKQHAFSPNQLVEHLVCSLGGFARDKRLDLIVSTDPSLPDYVRGDAARITQVIMNAAENAIKYTKRGYVHIGVTGRSTSKASELVFTVRDTGPGIPENTITDVSGTFQDVSRDPERQNGVSGLGLSLCRKLMQLMGGAFEIDSRIGKGTEIRIKIRLPVENRRAPEKASLNISAALPHCKILIVDDHRANFDALHLKLKHLGLSADYAKSARIAAKKMSGAFSSGRPYTLIFLDYLMPDVDGLLFANSIAQNPHYSNVEIIALSSVNDAEVEECFTSSNLATYLCKPITENHLETAIKAIAVRETLKLS